MVQPLVQVPTGGLQVHRADALEAKLLLNITDIAVLLLLPPTVPHTVVCCMKRRSLSPLTVAAIVQHMLTLD